MAHIPHIIVQSVSIQPFEVLSLGFVKLTAIGRRRQRLVVRFSAHLPILRCCVPQQNDSDIVLSVIIAVHSERRIIQSRQHRSNLYDGIAPPALPFPLALARALAACFLCDCFRRKSTSGVLPFTSCPIHHPPQHHVAAVSPRSPPRQQLPTLLNRRTKYSQWLSAMVGGTI